jgi:mRNA interferase RelE/StbE
MPTLIISDKAERDLDDLPAEQRARIVARMADLAAGLPVDIKKLAGGRDEYRLRVGDYRVLFRRSGGTIFIGRVFHRREAYRR